MEDLEQAKISTENKDAIISSLPYTLSARYREKMGKLIDLSEDKKKKLKKWLKSRIREWKEDSTDLHKRLEEDSDLVESVVYETSWPWEGASNVHVQITETYMDIFKSVETRSILGADLIWSGETDIDELRDYLADIEEGMNYKARNEWHIDEALNGVFFTTNRDSVGIIQDTWCEEYKKVNDIAIIGGIQDFRDEFPTPEDAGVSPEQYLELAAAAQAATDENPIEIPITYEKPVYYGNKYDIIELIDWVMFPANAPSIHHESCQGYGKRFTYSKGTIEKKGKDQVFYKDGVEELLKKEGKARGDNSYYESRTWVDGVKRTNKKNDYELYELVIKGEETDQEYIVTYSENHDVLLGCIEYYYRSDMYAFFRIDSRPNRFLGKSIPHKTRDTNDEIDTEHNQRINIGTITSVPSFKAHTDLKTDVNFDPEADENKWKPGRIFWSAHPDLFEQFKIQPTDQGVSLQEEANNMRILDLRLGSAASLLSGGVAPGDPNAPGNKTAIMIQQSNLRMDEPLFELRQGVSDLGDISMSHYYQFGPPMFTYQKSITNPDGSTKAQMASFPKKILRQGIHLKMKGITVVNNPDSEMQRLVVLYQQLMTVPEFQQNPQARVQLWRDALRAGRINNRDKYMPTLEEVQAQMVEMQKQAMIKMAAEKQAQEQAAAEAALKNRISSAQQNLQIKSLAQRTAENAMGQAEEAVPSANGAPPESPGGPVQ